MGASITQFTKSDNTFYYGNLIFRFILGVGDFWIQTTCKALHHYIYSNIGYSVLTFKYPENREKVIGMGEAVAGIGFMAGPAFGGLLFNVMGLFWTFTCFAVFLAFSCILCVIYVPSSMNNTGNEENESDDEKSS